MPSPESVNNFFQQREKNGNRRKKGSTAIRAHSVAPVEVVFHLDTFGKNDHPFPDVENQRDRIPEKLYPPKIGDAVHLATYDALTGNQYSYLESFIFNSRTHDQIEEDLQLLFGLNPRRYPDYTEFLHTIVAAGEEMARLVLDDIQGESVFIIEPSLTPVPTRHRKAGEALLDQVTTGKLDEFTILASAGPFVSTADGRFDHLSKRTQANLRTYSSPSTVYGDRDKLRYDIACDGIRADFVEINWQDVPGNEDMNDVISVLDMIKRGDTAAGRRRHILDFTSWVSNPVTYNGEETTAAEVFQIFLDKIHKGLVKVTINEIKAHAANISYIKGPVTNSRSQFTDAARLDPDLLADVGSTSHAFLNLARNFDARLQDRRFAAEFMRNIEVQILEANLRLADATGERHQSITAEEFRRRKPIIKRCRVKVFDLMKEWAKREEEIRQNKVYIQNGNGTHKKAEATKEEKSVAIETTEIASSVPQNAALN